MRPLSLVVVLHHHQPLGEDEGTLACAVDQAYRPLLEALVAFPKVRVALHLGGVLPEYLEHAEPAYLDRLNKLVSRGQVEILAGPHTGAVTHVIPERDALGQLQLSTRWIEDRFKILPRCAWLPEGAWDPTVPRLLSRVGVQMTFLHSGLVRGAGSSGTLDGWYVSEREGAAVGILPLEPRLSTVLPWASPRWVIQELQTRAAAGQQLVTIALPAERLGLHPHSLRWCWSRERGWVRRLFEALLAEDYWLRLTLPHQVYAQVRPAGRVSPASGTPPETGQAALSVEDGRAYAALQTAILEGRDPRVAVVAPWLDGPPWDANLVRYDEANRLHKHMLRTSLDLFQARRRLKESGDPFGPATHPRLEQARRALYRGQGAAAHHSAVGGGVLRGEIRHAAWRALLEADAAIRAALDLLPRIRHDAVDYDCDGQREVVINAPGWQAVVRPSLGGALVELGIDGLGNLCNTLTRREELWHDDLRAESSLPMLIDSDEDGGEWALADEVTAPGQREPTDDTTRGTDTASLSLPTTGGGLPRPPPLPPLEPDLDLLLWYDRSPRAAFQERFLGPQTTLENLRRGQHPELGDFIDNAYQLVDVEEEEQAALVVRVAREGVVLDAEHQRLVRVAKQYRFERDQAHIDVRYELTNRLPEPFHARFAVELNLNLDSGVDNRHLAVGNVGCWPLTVGTEERDVAEVHLVLADLGRRIIVRSPRPAHLYAVPVEVPIRTRAGYKAGFQGTCLVFAWDLSLWGGEKLWLDLSLSVESDP